MAGCLTQMTNLFRDRAFLHGVIPLAVEADNSWATSVGTVLRDMARFLAQVTNLFPHRAVFHGVLTLAVEANNSRIAQNV